MSDKRRYRQFDEWPNLEVANCAGVLNVADLDHYAKAWHAACELFDRVADEIESQDQQGRFWVEFQALILVHGRRSITPPLGVINADNRPESV